MQAWVGKKDILFIFAVGRLYLDKTSKHAAVFGFRLLYDTSN